MARSTTPTTAKASEKRSDNTEQPVTKLAEVNDPAKLTTGDINEISGDDGTDTRENSANQDVAETLKQDKAAAKSKDDPEPGYFHGQGGAAGV